MSPETHSSSADNNHVMVVPASLEQEEPTVEDFIGANRGLSSAASFPQGCLVHVVAGGVTTQFTLRFGEADPDEQRRDVHRLNFGH